MRVAFVIIHYSGLEDTLNCLTSLYGGKKAPEGVILVDNSGSKEAGEALKKAHPVITHLPQDQNLGFSGGCNVGLQYALDQGYEGIVLLNNDTIVDSELLTSLEEGSKAHPGAILGGKVYQMNEPELLDHVGGIWRNGRFELVGKGAKGDEFNEPVELDYVYGCCFFMPASVIKQVGLFDERFFLYWEEFDFCMRAKQLGISRIFLPTVKLWHKCGASSPNPTFQSYFYFRNQLLWIEKNIDQPFLNITRKVLSQLIRHSTRYLKHLTSRTESSFQALQDSRGRTLGMVDYFRRNFGAPPKKIL